MPVWTGVRCCAIVVIIIVIVIAIVIVIMIMMIIVMIMIMIIARPSWASAVPLRAAAARQQHLGARSAVPCLFD